MVYNIIIGRDEADKKKFGERGTVFIGRSYVKMGQLTSLSNNVYLDVARPHVIMISGKRGCLTADTLIFTGKGYIKIKDFNEKKDKIYSFNREKNTFEWEKAKLLKYSIKNEELFKINFEDKRKITITKEHPLLTYSGGKTLWKEGYKLKVNDLVVSVKIHKKVNQKKIGFLYSLNKLKIKTISKIRDVKKVYDLRVPKNHSFIANGIISHNSGKSFSLGVIAEEMSQLPQELKERISVLIFDTMGIFWTMKYQNEKEIDLLKKWNIKPKALDVKIYTPEGSFEKYKSQGFPTDYSFTIKTSELSANDWTDIFEISLTEPIGILIERIISQFQEENKDYSFEEIIKRIQEDTKSEKNIKDAAENRFLAARSFGLFGKKGTEIKDIVKPGQVSIIDTSAYSGSGSWNVKNLVIGLICKKLLAERILIRKLEELAIINEKLIERETEKMPLVWIFIDEAHSALPKEYKTPATDALVQLLREGRQPGISLVLATQQPGKIHEDVLTQSDIVISHRITSKIDIEALNSMMQTYLISDLQRYLNDLPKLKGSAIILDDNSERIYPARIRPRFTWHGGESPAAIKEEKYEEELEFNL